MHQSIQSNTNIYKYDIVVSEWWNFTNYDQTHINSIEWTFFCKHFNKIQIADSFRTIFFIPLFTFFLHGLWNRAVTKGSWWCYKMPGNLGKSSLAILFLLSSSVKCGTTLADQGHFVQERSNLWLFISSENQPWNHQEREPTTTKKELISAIFFQKRQKTWTRTGGNDSCDVYLILSNSGKYLRKLKIYQVSDHVIFRSSFKLAFVKVWLLIWRIRDDHILF